MTTLTATVNPDRASVALRLSPTATVASIIRHDANGRTPVRVPAGTFPTASAVIQLDDWEAALAGPVTYSAGGVSATVTMDGDRPWLVPVLAPSSAARVEQVSGLDSSRTTTTSVRPIQDGEEIIRLGTMGKRTGTFSVLCADHGVAALLEDLLGRYPQMFLKMSGPTSPADLYFVTRGTRITAERGTPFWALAVEYTETAAPAAALPSWTYRSLAASYGSLAAVAGAYADLEGLALNRGGS